MIILVRHGETAGNAARVVQREHTKLNDRGIEQARRVADRLATLGVESVLCSDLARARMTAEPIVARTQARIEYSPLLQERNFGDLRGTPYAELDFDIFAPDYHPPGGESWPQFHARVDRAWAHVMGRCASVSGNLLVLTHGLVCSSLAQRLLALPRDATPPSRWSNSSVTLCSKQPPHAVELLDCVAHLSAGPADLAPGPV
jgi:2,3-bisphosphoglycerate-dependent phosphoglycerate mutase